MEFIGFPKIARLSREIIISEKIDGTNAQIYIPELTTDAQEFPFLVGSRTRWITPENDNFGFAKWAYSNAEELLKLGPGQHFGEWWGSGIQRGYGLSEKRFSLFNTERWNKDNIPSCCSVVPVLYKGLFNEDEIYQTLHDLDQYGSKAAPGFLNPEGMVIWHEAARIAFKKTIKDDEKPKGK
jgi:hypothetical protein